MRVIVFFDLPVTTPAERREYARFRRLLIKSGFLMMQESVYSKLAPNLSVAEAIVGQVRKGRPAAGLVQMLTVTEKQYSGIELVLGESRSEVLADDRKLVIL